MLSETNIDFFQKQLTGWTVGKINKKLFNNTHPPTLKVKTIENN